MDSREQEATNDLFISYIADALLLSANSEFQSEHLKEMAVVFIPYDCPEIK